MDLQNLLGTIATLSIIWLFLMAVFLFSRKMAPTYRVKERKRQSG